MTEFEKVLKGLECCADDIMCPDYCPYKAISDLGGDCRGELVHDALELLKSYEPHVMTQEELENAIDSVVWIETKDLQENSSSQYALLESYSRKYGYFYLLHLRNEHPSVYPYTNINKTWRPWNIRPTDERRKAVKWNE